MALPKCPCAFQLRRLAQNAVRGIWVRHFSCKFLHKMPLAGFGSGIFLVNFHTKWLVWPVHVRFGCAGSYVCSPLCSHMCAFFCVLSSVCSHICAFICALAYVCFHMCAPIYVLWYVCSHVLSYVCFLCALICVSSSPPPPPPSSSSLLSSPPLVSYPFAPRHAVWGLLPG